MHPSDATEEELRAFVGPNGDYYVGTWLRYLNGEVRRPRFRAAAFWLAPFSLAYRKQYRALSVFLGLLFVEALLEDFVVLPRLGLRSAPVEWTVLVTIAAGSVAGLFANSWYLRDALRAISAVRRSGRPPDEQLSELARRGGRSPVMAVLAPLGVAAAATIVIAVVFAVLGIPME